MWGLCWRWRIPRKTDDSGWRDLEAKVASDAQLAASFMRSLDDRIADIDRLLSEADRIRDESKREKKIKDLRGKLRRLKHSRQIVHEEQKQAEQAGATNRLPASSGKRDGN